ncbi:coenzyme F420 hydrogenase subunit beta [Fibrobacter sp. UWH9]|uniref:Coenzyme F420 hydrogenase/dehydrogenase, beta subunit C-terminal domain n=1 Tax=unclassified Fibrobacter TaxID=2634177 RepID=UPI00091833AD|nr:MULTISPECIES: Coenzyme F420 hydrogenase/dehydrogenase, beta subunit C-terminal domain [unclassified Fibrobacter]OWV02730.1 coenzyme F420 hydrogenase [Fibrobacter sp. UWH3]SHH64578.1 coenzyme F420 hydrogenase subunit beta [Fibrobacter sp. UWH9]SHK73449.1 coenzyme F420 hydrogenase subunit beta [Fibrobacter sp. UWH6]
MENKTPNIEYTVKNNICTGCGVCQGACLSGAISMIVINGEFRPSVDLSKCNNTKGCHRCFDVCPGVGINLQEQAGKIFTDDGVQENKYIGRFLNCYVGHSNDQDLRYHAASGGTLSQFLIWLLENDKIDGAVVTRFEKESLLKVKTFIAKTKAEILSAKSSKYAPTSLYGIVAELKAEQKKRFVVVGVPCQIEGMRKLLTVDKKLQEKVCGLISVYCSGSRTFNFTEYVLKERNIDLDKLNYLAYRDNGCLGGLVAKGENIDFYEDYQSYSHPLRSMFFPRRCVLCADHFGELSDVSFGDIHIAPYSEDKIGVNSVVVRTTKWGELLENAKKSGALTLENLDSAKLIESQIMSKVKKNRNVSFGMLLKKLGKTAPDFGAAYDARVGLKTILNYAQIRLQQFIGRHKRLWFLIPFLKAKVKIY